MGGAWTSPVVCLVGVRLGPVVRLVGVRLCLGGVQPDVYGTVLALLPAQLPPFYAGPHSFNSYSEGFRCLLYCETHGGWWSGQRLVVAFWCVWSRHLHVGIWFHQLGILPL